MIRRVFSSLDGFREPKFALGMNIVLADQSEDSDETESTNGLGKTTLIRIIHFCLGSDLNRDKVLVHPDLAGVTFGMEFDHGGQTHTVTRNTGTAQFVSISSALLVARMIESEPVADDLRKIALTDYKKLLSELFYPQTTIRTQEQVTYDPSFRELAPYLARVGKGAYVDPQLVYTGQSGASKKLCVSFLLGLNWGRQRKLLEEIEMRSAVKAAVKALQAAEAKAGKRSIGELEAERVAIESQLEQKRSEVSNFNVRDDYRDLERELGGVDSEIHDLINANFSDGRLHAFYKQSASEQPEADASRPLQILQDAGAVFRAEALRTLDEVAKFHSDVYRNRKEFLKAEIARLQNAINDRTTKIDALSAEKQRLLSLLKSSGAIEALIALQGSLTTLQSRYDVIIHQIEEMKKFDRRDEELGAKISHERSVLKQDMEDRRDAIDEARRLFAAFTSELYGKPGRLGVDVDKDGYRFSFVIDRAGSDGVDQMVVFCFDLVIASLWAKRHEGFGTLIHDSSIFADVDPRQYAAALKLAAAKAQEFGFQYICCLNAGSLPTTHLAEFDLKPFTRLSLTDDGDSGRLLGKRLPPVEKGREKS